MSGIQNKNETPKLSENLENKSIEQLEKKIDDLIEYIEELEKKNDNGDLDKQIEECKNDINIFFELIEIKKKSEGIIFSETNIKKFEENLNKDIDSINRNELLHYLSYLEQKNLLNEEGIRGRISLRSLIEIPRILNLLEEQNQTMMRFSHVNLSQENNNNQFQYTSNFKKPNGEYFNSKYFDNNNSPVTLKKFTKETVFSQTNRENHIKEESKTINKISNIIGEILNPYNTIISKIKQYRGDGEKFYNYFVENPKDIFFIQEESILQDLINYYNKLGKKIDVKNLNPLFQNSIYLLDENIDLNNYLSVLAPDLNNTSFLGFNKYRVNSKEKILPYLLSELAKKEITQFGGERLNFYFQKLIEIKVNPKIISGILYNNNVGYLGDYIDDYIYNGNDYPQSEIYLKGKEKDKLFKGEFDNIISDYKNSDGIINVEEILKSSKDPKKRNDIEIISKFLFENQNNNEYEDLIIKLIEGGFSYKNFWYIFNEKPNFVLAHIKYSGLSIIQRISPENLKNKDVISGILNSGNDLKNIIYKIGDLDITDINRILQIYKFINERTKDDKEFNQNLWELIKNGKKITINFNFAISKGEYVEDEYKDIFNIIKNLYGENQEFIYGLDFYLEMKASAKSNAYVCYDRGGDKKPNSIDNTGTINMIISQINNIEGLDKNKKKKINKLINESIKINELINDEALMQIYYSIINDNDYINNKKEIYNAIALGFKSYTKSLYLQMNNSGIHKYLLDNESIFIKNQDGKEIFDTEKFFSNFKEEFKNELLEKHKKGDKKGINPNKEDCLNSYNKYIKKHFGELDNETKTELDKIFDANEIESLAIIVAENDGLIEEYFNSGAKGSISDFIKSKGINIYTYEPKSEIFITIQNLNGNNNGNNRSIEYNYNPSNGTIKCPINGKEIDIPLNQNEKNAVSKNPELIPKIVDFYKVLNELGIEGLWDIREEIFRGISDGNSIEFNIENNYINENETKIFLNSILKSLQIPEIPMEENFEQFKAKFKTYNNPNPDGTIRKEDFLNGRSNIEQIFFKKYYPEGTSSFKLASFKKNIE